jgi:hypothetical protein
MAFKRLAPAAVPPSAPVGSTAALSARLTAEAAAIAAAPPAPAPAAPVATAEVMPAPSRAVSTGAFGLPPSKPVGLTAMVSVAKAGGSPQPFPVVQLIGGGTGGGFAISPFVHAELHASLPQGKVNIPFMYLGGRYELQAWPKGFDDRAGEKERPSWTCAIPITDAAGVAVMTEACKKYNYTKKDQKDRFDFDASGVGHIRPVFQVIGFLQQFGGLVVISAPAHFNSAERSSESLGAHIDPTGALNPFPCTIRPVTATETNKAGTQTWKIHHLDFHGEPNPVGASVVKDFQAWYEEAKTDPELIAAFTEWINCLDNPLDANGLTALAKGKHL